MSRVTPSTTCPFCGASARPIVFGMPGPALVEAAERGEIELGGCVIGEGIPDWVCTGEAHHRWLDRDPPVLVMEAAADS